MSSLLNADDFERAASERLDPAVFDYVAGGGADEQTLRDNRDAFAAAHRDFVSREASHD